METALCRVESVSGRGRNKLRTYTTFKEEFTVEQYCRMIVSPLFNCHLYEDISLELIEKATN